ncbi:alpha/beta hydrolase family protein [Flavobacterium acetivorans]|uniref:alpha/beta hydrolase family protein n=1 Tax=Flavobacterium acetivorans TaxID=2893883 RepID=UPI001E629BE4|nr:prolyl oligopeptidase family serine peptidase [Flavobacterium sp. F-29]UFH34911.1 prolyl oligopeptidase family serine peptidase [Flavobacterium sp. F-29]
MTSQDYGKWSTITQENIAPNGKWISYKLVYDLKKDSMFVKNTSTMKQYCFPQANSIVFSENNQWFIVNQKKTVLLQNTSTDEHKRIDSVIKADFIVDGKFLVLLLDSIQTQDLLILDLKNKTDYKIRNIKEAVISPDKKNIVYITHNNAIHLFVTSKENTGRTLLEPASATRKNIIWNDEGTAITLLEEDPLNTDYKIYFIKGILGKEEIHCLNPINRQTSTGRQKVLYNPSFTPLLIAPDDKRIFFYTASDEESREPKQGVEVWNTANKLEYQRELVEGKSNSRPKLTVWWPDSGKTAQVNTNEFPSVYLTADRNKAIIFNPNQYEPQNEIAGPADLWITNLNSGKRNLILEKQSRKLERLGMAPNSRYLNYYRDKNWWIYDMELDKHTLVTDKLTDIENTNHYPGEDPPSYGFAGWSQDSQFLILYTQYDIWLITPDGKRQQRLTNASADKIRFRVCTNIDRNQQTFKSYDLIGTNFDLKNGLILEAFNTANKASGYYRWTIKDKLSKMIFKHAKLNRIKKASQKDQYILVEEKADVPPQIIYLDHTPVQKIVAKTNSHQDKFEWTKAELIAYKNRDGINLQGVLQYPAGYQNGKKYPMIVYIYEELSHLLHHYHTPTLYNTDGFNPANYTADGYFVLYPDIVYKEGRPGYSALDCVEAAVNEVVDKGKIEEKHIGLIGHSFGGYESSFIATQLKLFATAVAGAAYTDLVSNSLSVNKSGRSQMWRYQTHQKRMGKSLYQDYKGFIENSPIRYAQDITIPILSWTGKNDNQVDPQQTMALHMAMRSLKKKHIMLLYPEEGHALTRPYFQKDLTEKIKIWFDYYLKEIPFPINTGLD